MAGSFLLVSGAQTTSTQSSGVYIGGQGEAGASSVCIASSSGTNPTLTVWLQGSEDEGVTWFDIPAFQVLATNSTSTDQTGTLSKRNLCSVASTVGQYYASYQTVASQVRMKWEIGGTSTPTCTFTGYFRG